MDASEREALRRLEGEATPGPWGHVNTGKWDHDNFVTRDDNMGVAMQYALVWRLADAALIAAMRNALPDLLNALDAAEARAVRAERHAFQAERERDSWARRLQARADRAEQQVARVKALLAGWERGADAWGACSHEWVRLGDIRAALSPTQTEREGQHG